MEYGRYSAHIVRIKSVYLECGSDTVCFVCLLLTILALLSAYSSLLSFEIPFAIITCVPIYHGLKNLVLSGSSLWLTNLFC